MTRRIKNVILKATLVDRALRASAPKIAVTTNPKTTYIRTIDTP